MASFNGEILLSGHTYPTLNAAWLAARSAAQPASGASKGNQTIRLAAGVFKATATMYEPTNGTCISVVGSASTGQQVAAGSPPGLSSSMIVVTTASPISGNLFSLQNSSGTQAQGCEFSNLTIVGGGPSALAGSAFNLQWFRGLTIEDLTVNDSGASAFILGESTGTHQANFYMRNIVVSYDPGDGIGFTPATRPAYGVEIKETAIDSNIDTLFCRNTQTACIFNNATGNFFRAIHGFGFPYSCTSPPCDNHASSSSSATASWASDYVAYDTAGQSNYTDVYMDSPAIAAFYVASDGTTITNGQLFWPDQVSFPNANLANVMASVSAGLVISNVGCVGMSSLAGNPSAPSGAGGGWISYFASFGLAPSYSSISHLAGCGEYYQGRDSARQFTFDINGLNPDNRNFGSTGVVPKLFVTPLSTSPAEGGVYVENFSGGQADPFYSGFSGQSANYAVNAQGTIHTSGGLQSGTVAVASAATLTSGNRNVLASTSGGAYTLTLPSCFTPLPDGLTPTGMEMVIYKVDVSANALTLATSSSETITYTGVTASTLTVATAGARTLVCGPDSNWYAR